MAKIGVGGLVCSILGIVMIILLFILPVLFLTFIIISPGFATVAAMLILLFLFGGLILGIIGLILGIVGTVKDTKKGTGIAGIVIGAIDLVIILYILGAAMYLIAI